MMFDFDWLTILHLLFLLFIVIQVVRVWYADCDLTVQWATRFGCSASSLKGKVVWVTGASSGIGEHIAYEMAKGGCRLVLSARREAELERVKKQCLLYGPLKDEDVLVLPMDTLKFETHVTAKDAVLKHFGQIDILVNNAGRSQRAAWDKTPIEIDREMFELDVLGYLSVTKAVLPHMYERNTGQIACVTSITGKLGLPFSGSYTGVKHALHGWYSCLAIEAYPHNVHVTLLCPGPTYSNFLQNCFTEEVGKSYGEKMKSGENRLSTERCAYLCAVSIANKIYEAWICTHPMLLMLYVAQYTPSIAHTLGCKMGMKQITKIREGK